MPTTLSRPPSLTLLSPIDALKSPGLQSPFPVDDNADDDHEESIRSPMEWGSLVYRNQTKEMRLGSAGLGSLVAGASFVGEQDNGLTIYGVKVEVKHVNLVEATISGYLNITGLTDPNSKLTTYFDGEIIGPRHTFLTHKWEANKDVDAQHWGQFPAFADYANTFTDDHFEYDFKDKEVIFMRWKEHFLVPNHRVKSVEGASFAGFYYISLNTRTGDVRGYYYGKASEWFQAIKLKRVPERASQSYEMR